MFGFVAPVWTQDKPADNMQILRDKVKADKKVLVALNMGLTESQANDFWPIYSQYQKELGQINRRIRSLLESYAGDYNNRSLTNAKAQKLIDEFVSIEKAEADLKASFAPKLIKVLPAIKVARYLQIENKIRAIINFDIAAQVPLIEK
jgi:hypothetical protein